MLLKEVADKLQLLTRLEQHLGELERTRNILDEQYRTAAKLAEDRRTTEAVESNKVSSVRVIQKPVPPLLAEGNRRIILAAGVVLAGLAGGLAALMGHWLRTTYLVAAAVEQDLRIPVLVVVPEGAAEHATLLRLAIG
jgi:uncharacterized protein involved in exopolysaccharide biosynthesis